MAPRKERSWIAVSLAAGAIALATPAAAQVTCAREIVANVSAIDAPIMYNRLGAQNPNWMVFVLDRDLVANPPGSTVPFAVRADKRLRPIVVRVAAGDCLTVNFTNRLAAVANPNNAINQNHPAFQVDDQPAERRAGFHAAGLELRTGIQDDASNVGRNESSLAAPGETKVYQYYAPKEGAYLISSPGATFGSDGASGTNGNGLFGAVNVEPKGARFYRSQVTEEELRLATATNADGTPKLTPAGQPVIDYEARFPNTGIWAAEGKGNLPILNMLDGNVLVHTDINAIITGPNADGRFAADTYPTLENGGRLNPAYPNRLEPFREFTTMFHDEPAVGQGFPEFYLNPVTRHTLAGVKDGFMINYGSGGIGTEIIANRLRVGPMHDCLTCAYEEFFLTSFTVGDPAVLVNNPANLGLENVGPGQTPPAAAMGPKATAAFYPDDPANVHHSYTSDFVKFRNLHTGREHHVYHLHNHQWLFNPNDDNSNYLDAQGIGPGAGYTYEMVNGGSGNRNKSSGDAIYHCHFYPHFAQGMWYMWRIHDTYEAGTKLAVSDGADGFHTATFALKDGTPAAGARALPDGEIVAGTPIPAVVPLPGKPLAPMPGRVTVVPNPLQTIAGTGHPQAGQAVPVGSLSKVDRTDVDPECASGSTLPKCDPTLNPNGLRNPGYPFWIAGMEDVVGQRPPTPPLDMDPRAGGFDGGLPRSAFKGFAAGGVTAVNEVTRLDFSKVVGKSDASFYPEDGTDVEKVAMAYHATKFQDTFRQPDLRGTDTVAASFRLNGARPVPGAPFSDPCIDDTGTPLADGLFWKDQAGAAGTPIGAGSFFDATGGITFGQQAGRARLYQGANIQFDAVFNKVGYHYPQQRIIALWNDVLPTINKQRPPEPLVIRNNTYDCTMYQHSNLVPEVFELDDYQVRTPTDIIGQHIHLPKWDLTTTDGAANGWNYEDGTLSPGAVRERIEAWNCFNGEATACRPGIVPGTPTPGFHPLHPAPHPVLGAGPRNEWLGARVTLQRWFFDPLFNVKGEDRGLGIIFTHDHYGPSTHQQIGLYATVLTEPAGSRWVHNETGQQLYDGVRQDGGPTSWQAAILPPDASKSFREFYFEFSDFQHAYQPGVYVGRNQDGSIGAAPTANSFRDSVNPSFKQEVGAANLFPNVSFFPPFCPGGVPRPCPEAISVDDPGMLVVNYRNEPVALRVFDPNALGPDGKAGTQAAGDAGDLSHAYESRTDRAIAAMNVQPKARTSINGTLFPPPINAGDVSAGDPFTPMVRAHYGDTIRMKIQAGGQEESHSASIHGMKWLQAGSGHGSAPNSGWRNSQHAGISEQFTLRTPVLPALRQNTPGVLDNTADYLYSINPGADGWWSGTWGLIRTYAQARRDLFPLPNNAPGRSVANAGFFAGVCPKDANGLPANVRSYDVTAVLANDVLGNAIGATLVPADRSATGHVGGPLKAAGGTLVYNPLAVELTGIAAAPGAPAPTRQGPLHDPTAILWVRTSDLTPVDPACKGGATNAACAVKLAPNAPVEPIVLRAAAGECVQVTVRNRLPLVAPELGSYTEWIRLVRRNANDPDVNGMTHFNANLVRSSSKVGLHTALLAYDINQSDGTLIGANPKDAIVAPGKTATVQFYAGDVDVDLATMTLTARPVELGGAIINSADKLKQAQKGMIGSFVVEPAGATWNDAGELTFDHQQAAKPKTRRTRAQATVSANGTTFRDFAVVIAKAQAHKYVDGRAVENVAAEGGILAEDSEDSGQMSMNYGSEPMWFRFGLMPNVPFGNTPGGLGAVPNAGDAYSNRLVTGGVAFGEPSTPVFEAKPGAESRLRLTVPASNIRASVYTLHGHVWQRTPYGCGITSTVNGTEVGLCKAGELGSRDIGQSPNSFGMGAQDLFTAYSHFEFILPRAGGTNSVEGDFLLRDTQPLGNLGGLWGLFRVDPFAP
ncbi:MAG TPA: hypothetical protein VFL83_02060 [Anaeromyxobacter sp.]|nr:hypothetical protein [Anaeromyxobacter sp.]